MYGDTQPLMPNMQWSYHRPPRQGWDGSPRPRAPFHGHHPHFNAQGPPLQFGNEDYWCETCDRGFPNQNALAVHKQQHQKCNIDGCQFIAHPKVITKHIQMQHSSGLYKKIANINKPEEIEKWREERRKKYPTKANIDKKAAILEEKIKRGEKMGLDRRNHYNKDRKPDKDFKRKYSRENENEPKSKYPKRNNNNRKPRKPIQKPPPVENIRALKPFAGISSLLTDSDNEIEEESECNYLIEDEDCESTIDTEKAVTPNEPTLCGALSSLICDYGSSDDEQDIQTDINKPDSIAHSNAVNKSNPKIVAETSPIKADKVIEKEVEEVEKQNKSAPSQSTAQNAAESDNDSGPEEMKVVKEDVTKSPTENITKNPIKRKVVIDKKKVFRKPKPKLPSTLLHKLLFKEMRQERNIILQCIRYIKRNNYFDNKK